MEDWIIEFIKRNEDFIPVAKKLEGETHPTVGYGTYQYYANGKPVKEGDKITEEAAVQQILQYINKVMPEVYKYFPEFDNYPSQMKGAIIDTIYRGGGTSLKNSPAFVGAINKGFEDKKFSAKELAAIVKEMGLKVVNPAKDSPSNLNDRKERRAAMMYGIYNTEHDDSIRSLGGKGAKTTPYTNFHVNVQKPGTMWNTVYKTSTSPADFAVRLWDTDRETIPDWETDTPTSNKLGYVTEGDHEIIFPLVQYVDAPLWKFWADRELVDYTDPKYKMSQEDIYKKAVQRGDTLHVPKGAALPFIRKYETYIPGLKKGNKIHIKEKNKGKFTESAKRAGKSVQEHARDVVNDPKATKLQKRRAQFALNSKKFKHQNGGHINYLNLF